MSRHTVRFVGKIAALVTATTFGTVETVCSSDRGQAVKDTVYTELTTDTQDLLQTLIGGLFDFLTPSPDSGSTTDDTTTTTDDTSGATSRREIRTGT
jgi:hypothetical protein